MEELNSKKLKARDELSTLENDKEKGAESRQEAIDKLKNELASRHATYKDNHKRWVQKQEAEIKMREQQHKRETQEIHDSIKDAEDNYEEQFQQWKGVQEHNVDINGKALDDFKKDMDRKIKSKNDFIKEIDNGIANLKEISKDQKEK